MFYKRYVDDINLIAKEPPNKLKRVNTGDNFTIETNPTPTPLDTKNDANLMFIIKQIGNSIHPSIQLKADYPSLHKENTPPSF